MDADGPAIPPDPNPYDQNGVRPISSAPSVASGAQDATLSAIARPQDGGVALMVTPAQRPGEPEEPSVYFLVSPEEADAFALHCIRAAYGTRQGMALLAKHRDMLRDQAAQQAAAAIEDGARR